MATKHFCDICGSPENFFSNFTRVIIESNDPLYEDTRMDVCSKCKCKLKKYIYTIIKEK